MENEKFVIVFNGEIYNHLEIRILKLQVILWAFTQFGIEETISKFAIALFDKLYLIRDRVGIKPLFKMMNLYFQVS